MAYEPDSPKKRMELSYNGICFSMAKRGSSMGAATLLREDFDGPQLRGLAKVSTDAGQDQAAFGACGDL